MTTPSKSMILEKAIQLFHNDRFRADEESFNITPTEAELKENGYFAEAQSELMRDSSRISEDWESYSDMANFENFTVDVAEALKSGNYISGTTGSGKSDVGMYAVDAIKTAYPETVFVIFDPSQDWMHRSSIARVQTLTSAYIGNVPSQSIIYDLSLLNVRDCQRLIENFDELLMRQQAQTHSKTRYFLCFEEAHTYFPEGCMRSKAYQNTVRMMTQGRNFKVRFMCITQFAALIDKNAMRYMTQRYFGQTNEVNDIDYIRKILGDGSEQLKTLNAGEFLYWHKGKVSKISVEPYKSSVAKKQIVSATTPKVEPLPKAIQQKPDSYALAKLLVIGGIGLIILLLGAI